MNATHGKTNGPAQSLTFSHTVPPGGYAPGLVVGVMITPDGWARYLWATYGGTPMQRVWNSDGGPGNGTYTVAWFHLIAPNPGTANVEITYTGGPADNVYFTAIALNVTNFGGIRSAGSASTWTVTNAPSVTVPSAANDIVIDLVASRASGQLFSMASPPSQVLISDAQNGQMNVDAKSAVSWKPGAATVPMSWGLAVGDRWAISAISVMPVGVVPMAAPPDVGPVSFQGVLAHVSAQTNTLRWNHEVRSIDTALVVMVASWDSAVMSVTYAGIPLTLHANSAQMYVFSLVNPPSGIAEVAVSVQVPRSFSAGAYSVRSDGVRNAVVNNTDVPSVANDLVLDLIAVGAEGTTFEPGPGQTEVFDSGPNSVPGGGSVLQHTAVAGSYERATGTTTTMTWTITPNFLSFKMLASMLPESDPLPPPQPDGQLRLFLDVNADFSPDAAGNFVPGTAGNNLSLPPPSAANAIQRVRLLAAYVDSSGAIVPPPSMTSVEFSLVSVSQFAGIAMNAPDPRAVEGPDFALISPTIVQFGSQPGVPTDLVYVDMDVWDYGGFTTVRAVQGEQTAELRLPVDAGNNWIPDAGWRATANGQVISSPIVDVQTIVFRDDDQDTIPQGGGVMGDGLINFEEYRGFIVRGEHRRTNPYKRDLFIDSTLPTNIGFAVNLPITVHWVNPGELSTNADPFNRATYLTNNWYINDGSGGTLAAHTNQRGIRVRDEGYGGFAVFGLTPDGCSEVTGCTPNYEPTNPAIPISWARVYVRSIREFTPKKDSQMAPDDPDDNAIRHVTGHEVGHMVNMIHNVWAAGAPLTLMLQGFDWPNLDWNNLPSQYGDNQYELWRLQIK